MSTRWVHYTSVFPTIPAVPTLPDHLVPPQAPPALNVSHLPNQVDPPTSSNGFSDLYLLDSEDDSVIDKMSVNDKINPIISISSYIRSPLLVALRHPSPKVAKKRRKNLRRLHLSSIRRNKSDTMALD